jgi:hypothetical protein
MATTNPLLRGILDRLAQKQVGQPGVSTPVAPYQQINELAARQGDPQRIQARPDAGFADPFGGGTPQSVRTPAAMQGAYDAQRVRINGAPGASPRLPITDDPTFRNILANGANVVEATKLAEQARASQAQEAQRTQTMTSLTNDYVAPTQLGGTVPQGDRTKFLEYNLADSLGGAPLPDRQAQIDAYAEVKTNAAKTAYDAAFLDRTQANAELTAASAAYQANPNPQTELAFNRAKNHVATAEAAVARFGVPEGQQWTPLGLLGEGLGVLDIPRAMVVEEMGANAYDVASGKRGKWGADLAGVAAGNWDIPIMGRLTQDFEAWANDPNNWQLIRNASENGFQAGPDAPRFTGGRAVWELFINSAGMAYKATMDVFLDPTILMGTSKSVGTGVRRVGEGLTEADDIGQVAKGVGWAGRGIGRILEAPQAVSDVTVDAVIPGVFKGAKAGLESIPVVGRQIEKATEFSAQEMARRTGDSAIKAGADMIKAVQDAARLLVGKEPPASIEEAVRQTNLGENIITGPGGQPLTVGRPRFMGTPEDYVEPPSAPYRGTYQSGLSETMGPILDAADPSQPNVFPGTPAGYVPPESRPLTTIGQSRLGPAGNPIGDAYNPQINRVPQFPGTTADQPSVIGSPSRPPVRPGDVPDINVLGRPGLANSGENGLPAGRDTGLVDPQGRPISTTAPDPLPALRGEDPALAAEQVPALQASDARVWTNPEYRRRMVQELRQRYGDEPVDAYEQAAEVSAKAHREKQNTYASGSKRPPTDHVKFVVEQRQIFRDHFPDMPFPDHIFRNGDELVLGQRQNMIEHAVFGSDADARRVRQWFHIRNQSGMARTLDDLRAKAAGQQTLQSAPQPTVAATPPVEQAAPTQETVPQMARPGGQLPDYTTASLADIDTDLKAMQNRKTAYSEQSVQNIVNNYNPNRFEPVEVRQNPNGRYTVLSGHSRHEAWKRLANRGVVDERAMPIKIQRGTDAELELLAQTSNLRGTPNTFTEKGALLKRLLDSGMDFDQVLREANVGGGGEAKRLLALNDLPTELMTAVDEGRISLRQGAILGDSIRNGTFSPAEAANFYLNQMAVKGYSDIELTDALKVLKEMKAQLPQSSSMDMFGGMDLGSSGAAEAFDLIRTLGAQRRQLSAMRREVSATLRRRGGSYSEATRAELQRDVDALGREVMELEARLGLHKPTAVFKRPSPTDVGAMPYFWRLAEHEKALRAAQSGERSAMQVRLASQGLGPGNPGPIVADDTTAELAKTFQNHPNIPAGTTYGDRLQEIMGKPWDQATPLDLHAAGAKFRDDIAIEMNVPDPTLWEKTMVRAGRGFSAFMLLPLWNAPRYLLVNTGLGNSMQAMLGGQARAIKHMWEPSHVKALEKLAWKNELPTSSPAYQNSVSWGLGGFDPKHVGHSIIDAITSKASSKVRNAGGKSRPGLVGSIKPGDFVAKWTGQNITRNVNNGLEWSARTGLWSFQLDVRATAWKKPYIAESVNKLSKKGFPISEGDFRTMMATLPKRFSGTDVFKQTEKLALSSGMDAQKARGLAIELGKDWANKVNVAEREASAVVDKVFFDLSERNIDRALKGVVPFHMWYTRALPFYVEQGLRHPGFAAAYYRGLQGAQAQAEAEGWPRSLRGYMKMWEGPGGMLLFFNPIAAMTLLDAFIMQDGGYTPENMSAIGKVLNGASNYGFGLLPWWSAVLNYAGYMGDSSIGLDPVGSYGARKIFGGLIQVAAANGLFGEDWQKYLGRPAEAALQSLRALTSGRLPGSSKIDAKDPGAYGAEMIRNIMLTDYLRQIGMTEEQYHALGSSMPGTPEREQYNQINETILSDWDNEGDLYDSALEQYANSGALQILTERIIMGGTKMRQENMVDRSNSAFGSFGTTPGVGSGAAFRIPATMTDPYADGRISGNELQFLKDYKAHFGVDYREGDLERIRSAVRTSKDITELTVEAAPLVTAQTEYYLLGKPQDRVIADYWNAIAFGDIPESKPVRFKDGRAYTRTQLMAMDQDQRFALADAWMIEHDPNGTAQKLRDERKLYVESHPEYKMFTDWRREMNQAWGSLGPNGVAMYRAQLVKENPNAARWLTQEANRIRAKYPNISASQLQAELDKSMQGMRAYMAIFGIQNKIGDATPLNAGSDPRPPGWTAESSNSSNSGTPAKSWDVKVKEAVAGMEAWMRDANMALSAAYGTQADYMNMPPIIKADADARLAAMGIEPPADAWIYWKWIAYQREATMMGRNPSMAAFIEYTRQTEEVPAP